MKAGKLSALHACAACAPDEGGSLRGAEIQGVPHCGRRGRGSRASRELGMPQLTLRLAGLSGSYICFSLSRLHAPRPLHGLLLFFQTNLTALQSRSPSSRCLAGGLACLALTPVELASSVQYCLARVSGFRLERQKEEEERETDRQAESSLHLGSLYSGVHPQSQGRGPWH